MKGSRDRAAQAGVTRQTPGPSRRQVGATMVEFALIAPLFFLMVFGIFSAATYVLEVQIANQSAQAAARWAVAAANLTSSQCISTSALAPPPAGATGMYQAARAAAGPFATSLSLEEVSSPTPATVTPSAQGCETQVTIPYVSFGGFFDLGPTHITATAFDYVT